MVLWYTYRTLNYHLHSCQSFLWTPCLLSLWPLSFGHCHHLCHACTSTACLKFHFPNTLHADSMTDSSFHTRPATDLKYHELSHTDNMGLHIPMGGASVLIYTWRQIGQWLDAYSLLVLFYLSSTCLNIVMVFISTATLTILTSTSPPGPSSLLLTALRSAASLILKSWM